MYYRAEHLTPAVSCALGSIHVHLTGYRERRPLKWAKDYKLFPVLYISLLASCFLLCDKDTGSFMRCVILSLFPLYFEGQDIVYKSL